MVDYSFLSDHGTADPNLRVSREWAVLFLNGSANPLPYKLDEGSFSLATEGHNWPDNVSYILRLGSSTYVIEGIRV